MALCGKKKRRGYEGELREYKSEVIHEEYMERRSLTKKDSKLDRKSSGTESVRESLISRAHKD